MENSWDIRRASDADATAIVSLHSALNRPPRADSVTSEYFVAMAGCVLIGCAAAREREDLGYLYGLAVERRWRKRGIGHALTQQRLEWLRSEGASSAFVLAMFWNIRFFMAHGFQLAARNLLRDLTNLHGDFSQSWSCRSALLVCRLR